MRLATISYERSRNGMSTGFADPATTETAAYSVETVKPMIKRAALGLDWKNDVPSLQELLATVAGWTNGDTGPITASATNDNDTLRVEQLEVREGSETARRRWTSTSEAGQQQPGRNDNRGYPTVADPQRRGAVDQHGAPP